MRRIILLLVALAALIAVGGFGLGIFPQLTLFPIFSDFQDELVLRVSEPNKVARAPGFVCNVTTQIGAQSDPVATVGATPARGFGTCVITATAGADIQLRNKPAEDRLYRVTVNFSYAATLRTVDAPASINLRVVATGPSGILQEDLSPFVLPREFANITFQAGQTPNPRDVSDTGRLSFILPVKANNQDKIELRISVTLSFDVGNVAAVDPGEASGAATVRLITVEHRRR